MFSIIAAAVMTAAAAPTQPAAIATAQPIAIARPASAALLRRQRHAVVSVAQPAADSEEEAIRQQIELRVLMPARSGDGGG